MQEGFGYQLDMRLLQSASIEEKFGDTQANAKKKIRETQRNAITDVDSCCRHPGHTTKPRYNNFHK